LKRQSFSINIPTFNRAGLIKRAIDCAFSEIITGDEIIVVDNGSTDGTEQVLLSFGGNIRYFKISKSGAGTARNFGICSFHNQLAADPGAMVRAIPAMRRLLISKLRKT
jgi:glycosyltransferase involved in cell wall biosynthesis